MVQLVIPFRITMHGTDQRRYSPIAKRSVGSTVSAMRLTPIHVSPTQTATLLGGYGNYLFLYIVMRFYGFNITNWFSGVDILDLVQMLVFLVQFSMPTVRTRLETLFTPRSRQVSPDIYNNHYILTSSR